MLKWLWECEHLLAALDDPNLGGLFDSGEGEFFFDEESKILFLEQKFSVHGANSKDFSKAIEDLFAKASDWSLYFLTWLAGIVHGRMFKPTQKVTCENFSQLYEKSQKIYGWVRANELLACYGRSHGVFMWGSIQKIAVFWEKMSLNFFPARVCSQLKFGFSASKS